MRKILRSFLSGAPRCFFHHSFPYLNEQDHTTNDFIFEVEEEDSDICFCRCEYSQNHPFCDDAHLGMKGSIQPVKVHIPESGRKVVCTQHYIVRDGEDGEKCPKCEHGDKFNALYVLFLSISFAFIFGFIQKKKREKQEKKNVISYDKYREFEKSEKTAENSLLGKILNQKSTFLEQVERKHRKRDDVRSDLRDLEDALEMFYSKWKLYDDKGKDVNFEEVYQELSKCFRKVEKLRYFPEQTKLLCRYFLLQNIRLIKDYRKTLNLVEDIETHAKEISSFEIKEQTPFKDEIIKIRLFSNLVLGYHYYNEITTRSDLDEKQHRNLFDDSAYHFSCVIQGCPYHDQALILLSLMTFQSSQIEDGLKLINTCIEHTDGDSHLTSWDEKDLVHWPGYKYKIRAMMNITIRQYEKVDEDLEKYMKLLKVVAGEKMFRNENRKVEKWMKCVKKWKGVQGYDLDEERFHSEVNRDLMNIRLIFRV